MEGMLATVVDRINNNDRKVEEPPLALTKYRVHQTSSSSSSSSSRSPANGNGKTKSKASGGVGAGVVEVAPEDSDRRLLEVRMCVYEVSIFVLCVHMTWRGMTGLDVWWCGFRVSAPVTAVFGSVLGFQPHSSQK